MTTLTITLTLQVPDGVELVDVDASLAAPASSTVHDLFRDVATQSAGVAARVESAPEQYQAVLNSFIERCADELGCRIEVPQAKRDDYLNVYAVGTRGGRVASFMVRESAQFRGPRVEIYCNPDRVAEHPPAEPDLHNHRPVQAKLYLGDPGALDAAVALVKIAIEERQ
jgi:hypothetical protein